MRHLIITIALMLTSVGAMAQKSFQDALTDFIMQNNVTSYYSESMGQQPSPWHVLQYTFTVANGARWKSQLAQIIQGYRNDQPIAEFSHMADGKSRKNGSAFVFGVSTNPSEPAITIGANMENSIIIVRKRLVNTGQRYVCAIEWKESEAKPNTIEGMIYIITGDSKVSKGVLNNDNWVKATEAKQPSERIRRMLFYKEKAEKDGVSEAIVMGACMAGKDISEYGTIEEIEAAKLVLDIIMAGIKIPSSYSKEYMKNSREGEMLQAIGQLQMLLSEKTRDARQRSVVVDPVNTIDKLRELESADTVIVETKVSKSIVDKALKTHREIAAVELLLGNAKNYTKGNFKLNGTKDAELWDVGYYIYKGNDDFTFPINKHDDVRVDGNGHFSYACDLKDITWGKVNAIMKDGTICSAWIEIPFVPGETAQLYVHNGFYSLAGSKFYQEWEAASNAGSMNIDDIIKNHIKEYGFICYVFKAIPYSSAQKQEIWNHLPKSVQNNHIGRFLKKCM